MKPAFCAGNVVQLSISRKRAMKSCHPAESRAPRAKIRQVLSKNSLNENGNEFFICTFIAPFKTLSH
jgi:hypothetical protein